MTTASINWQQLLPNDGSEVAKVCLGLLKKLWTGQLSYDEFVKENHYVAIGYPNVLNSMKVRQLPSCPPAYKDMMDLKAKKPTEFNTTAFIKDHPEVSSYLTRESSVVHANKANAEKLEELYDFFSDLGDSVSAMKIRAIYEEYPRSIYHGSNVIWMKRPL